MSRLVATISAGLLALLLEAPPAALAAPYADPASLDTLFAALKASPNPIIADEITAQIWKLWFNPNVPALADEMTKSSNAQAAGDLKGAKAILDQVVAAYPDYAEGWNQRATVEYEMNDLSDSLDDIAKTLALEPRHFGALSGRVLIDLQQGRRADALKDVLAALAIHPFLSEKRLFPELTEENLHL